MTEIFNRVKTSKKLFFLIIFSALFIFLLFSRFFNLDYTARFTQDESSDLARMHAYWQEKRVTLVGPISTDGSKVFGSLTYYMQMPFAVVYNFHPVGPAVGTAFWGVITIIVLFWISLLISQDLSSSDSVWQLFKNSFLSFTIKSQLQNDCLLWLFWVLIIIWPTLLVTSRWAWNPHLIPFWISTSLLISLLPIKQQFLKYLLISLSLGLTIHHHYLAVFAIGSFLCLEFLEIIRDKNGSNGKKIFGLLTGFSLSLLPFLIFDLRHPPGLFLTRYLVGGIPHLENSENASLIHNLYRNISVSLAEISHLWWLQLPFLAAFLVLIYSDIKHKVSRLKYLFPAIFQILACIFIDNFTQRYFLPGAIFFLVWLILPRQDLAKKIQVIIISTMVLSSVLKLPSALFEPIMSPPMRVVVEAGDVIVNILDNNPEIHNHNIAALTANDLDSLGLKYRDLLSIKGISFRAVSEYDATEHLFVVTDVDQDEVRNDQNVAMAYFKEGVIRAELPLKEKPWRVFWFSF